MVIRKLSRIGPQKSASGKLGVDDAQTGSRNSVVRGGPESSLPTIHSVAESGGLSDVFVLRSAEFLGESDEKPFRPADVAEPIRVFILDYFAYELRAALAELFKRLVDVVHGEHDAEVA